MIRRSLCAFPLLFGSLLLASECWSQSVSLKIREPSDARATPVKPAETKCNGDPSDTTVDPRSTLELPQSDVQLAGFLDALRRRSNERRRAEAATPAEVPPSPPGPVSESVIEPTSELPRWVYPRGESNGPKPVDIAPREPMRLTVPDEPSIDEPSIDEPSLERPTEADDASAEIPRTTRTPKSRTDSPTEPAELADEDGALSTEPRPVRIKALAPRSTVIPQENGDPAARPQRYSETDHLQRPDEPPFETPPRRELTSEQQLLKSKVRRCLAMYYARPENTAEHSPWGIMHAMLPYGVDSNIIAYNRKVNAIGWLCFNGNCRGQRLMSVENGHLKLAVGPGVQGHEGQFLAMLAQSRVKLDYALRVDGQEFTIKDLVRYEMFTCKPRTELTFKLISLAHYLPPEQKWKSFDGDLWSIPRLISEEIDQPVIGSACGGTHRLMGLSYSVYKREKHGQPVDGEWARARKYVKDYQDYTFRLQNPEGSFSTNWFEARGAIGSQSRFLETTGHILEWMVFSLPESQLNDARIVRAVDFVATTMMAHPYKWEIGPCGHALHALAIYDERLFGGRPGEREEQLAEEWKNRKLR